MMEKVKGNSDLAKWTFLVYMAGDNNLDGAALRDIAEMAKAGSTKDVHILVQLDRVEDQKIRRFRINPACRALDFCAVCRWPAFLGRVLR